MLYWLIYFIIGLMIGYSNVNSIEKIEEQSESDEILSETEEENLNNYLFLRSYFSERFLKIYIFVMDTFFWLPALLVELALFLIKKIKK